MWKKNAKKHKFKIQKIQKCETDQINPIHHLLNQRLGLKLDIQNRGIEEKYKENKKSINSNKYFYASE